MTNWPNVESRNFLEIGRPIFEVELKFRIDSLANLRQKLIELGAKPECLTVQSDLYLDDPLRKFADLDYALRIRKCGENFGLTFKGPNLAATSKTREELEVALHDAAAAETLQKIFTSMGYLEVAKVTKTREQLSLEWSHSTISIALDEVDELGDFVELICAFNEK